MARNGRKRGQRRRLLTVLIVLFVIGAGAFLFADMTRRAAVVPVKHPLLARRIESAPADGIRVIQVGPARLTLDTGTQISVPIEEHPGRWRVDLKRGRVRAEVRPLKQSEYFAVQTFNVTAGVRGTVFTVALIGGYRTEVEVLEGKVSVEGSGGTPIYVAAGQVVSASGLEEPELIRDTGGRPVRHRWYDQLPVSSIPIHNATPPGSSLSGSASDASRGESAIQSDRLSGSGTWSGSQGFGGALTITIDPTGGKFFGQFTGAAAGGVSIKGSFHGDFDGDTRQGVMNGAVDFQTHTPGPTGDAPSVAGQVQATMKNGVVSGRMKSPVVQGEFEIRLK